MESTLLIMFQSYLGGEYDSSMETVIRFCINRAITSFRTYMNYPADYSVIPEGETQSPLEKDMEANIYCLFDLAFYYWNLQGIEFQTEHTENNVKRTYNTEATIYATHGVVPFAGTLD